MHAHTYTDTYTYTLYIGYLPHWRSIPMNSILKKNIYINSDEITFKVVYVCQCNCDICTSNGSTPPGPSGSIS